MVELSGRDVLELLGYVRGGRHPLEILGYDYSTRGMKRFRAERPDFLPQVRAAVEGTLREAGAYPGAPSEEVRLEGVYLERRGDGTYRLHTSVEVGMCRYERVYLEFPTASDAAMELIRRTAAPDYLPALAGP